MSVELKSQVAAAPTVDQYNAVNGIDGGVGRGISYNGILFPASSRITRFERRNVYDKTDKKVSFEELTISVEFYTGVFQHESAQTQEGSTSNTSDKGVGGNNNNVALTWVGPTATNDNSKLPDVWDAQLAERLSSRLMEPGKAFEFWGYGFGRYWVFDPTEENNTSITGQAYSNTERYIGRHGTPTPQDITSEVITTAGIQKHTWTCILHIRPRGDKTDQRNPGRTDGLDEGYFESISFRPTHSIDANGKMSRTTVVTISGAAYPRTEPHKVGITSDDKEYQNDSGRIFAYADEVNRLFPLPNGFTRSFNSITENEAGTELTVTIQDTERQTSEALPLGLSKFENTYNASMNRQEFGNWTCTLTVDCTVLPNYPKDLAWDAARSLLADLTMKARLRAGRIFGVGITTTDALNQDNANTYTQQAVPAAQPLAQTHLLSVDITDSRHTRDCSFEFKWLLVGVDFKTILNASGLLLGRKVLDETQPSGTDVPVAEGREETAPSFNPKQDWNEWYIGQESVALPSGYRDPNSYPNIVMQLRPGNVFDTPDYSRDVKHPKIRFYNDQETPPEFSEIDNYTVYVNHIKLFRDNGNIYYQTYNTSLPVLEDDITENVGSRIQGHDDNIWDDKEVKTIYSNQERSATFSARSRSRNLVLIYGYAERLDKMPQVPQLKSMGGATATPYSSKTHKDVIDLKPRTVYDPETLKEKTRYRLEWQRWYILDRPPTDNTVVSNYAPRNSSGSSF